MALKQGVNERRRTNNVALEGKGLIALRARSSFFDQKLLFGQTIAYIEANRRRGQPHSIPLRALKIASGMPVQPNSVEFLVELIPISLVYGHVIAGGWHIVSEDNPLVNSVR